jgi:hypothetical protein
MIAAIQLSIMLGGALGGFLLDHVSITATFAGGASLLVLAALIVGHGARIQPTNASASSTVSANARGSAHEKLQDNGIPLCVGGHGSRCPRLRPQRSR